MTIPEDSDTQQPAAETQAVSPAPVSPDIAATGEETAEAASQQTAPKPEPESFAAHVERLVAEGKLTPAEAAELLEPVQAPAPQTVNLDKGAQTAPRGFLARFQTEADGADGGVPNDLRLEVSGYGLQVVLDPSLPEPRLTSNHEGMLSLRAGPDGWTVEHSRGARGLGLRAVLSLPWSPRHVRAEVSGGNLNLPDLLGTARIEVSGGNATLGTSSELRAEVSGGNLAAGEVAGALQLEVNGGNLSVSGASALRAEVNGGNLSWSGRLTGGDHHLEVNGGQGTLRLAEGSSVEVNAESTLGSVSASFPLQKMGGMLHATYSGRLGSGEARLKCEVNAGQIKVVTS